MKIDDKVDDDANEKRKLTFAEDTQCYDNLPH